jgi:hypothetical protein
MIPIALYLTSVMTRTIRVEKKGCPLDKCPQVKGKTELKEITPEENRTGPFSGY